ncbi:hypothetical protein EX895_005916 [Sporisorium graminicola]|uniref:Uncharacterized protein n=1 Tax=Sporisorium graminicola TaxID=280036 RepID=A0A4U7KLY5_9BASI|nr:hypothetical protein EX895_005916 [Sporisorium graminicola]TKY84836.1 hypothetical protein EX895_005916 [Sporisorium graminicola]
MDHHHHPTLPPASPLWIFSSPIQPALVTDLWFLLQMPRKSEIARTGPTRMSKVIETSGGDLDRMASHLRSVQVLDEQFEDWTDAAPHVYRAMTTLWDNFSQYYEQVYCVAYPAAPTSSNPLSGVTFDVSGVDQLFKRITHFLTWCLENTPGKFGEQYVNVLTFRAWVSNMVSLVISELRQLDRSLGVLISGWTQRGQDGLYTRLYSWARSTADSLQLRRKPKRRPSYGKFEASLLITHILENADSAHRWESTLQKVTLVQFMLNTGLRPGEFCKPDRYPDFLRLCDIEVRRDITSDARYEWHIVLHVENWKGGRDPLDLRDVQNITLHPSKHTQNLQFELATTLIPVLIHRGALEEQDAHGNSTMIESLEQFLRSKSMIFRGVGTRPLFCKTKNNSFQQEQPLEVALLLGQLGDLYTKVGLGGGGSYHFRYHKGDKIRILYGAAAQSEVLHHKTYGTHADVGYVHYSAGMDVHPVNCVLLDESLTPDEEAKLQRAGFYFRQQMSDAMVAVVRKFAAQEADVEDVAKLASESKLSIAGHEEVARRVQADPTYLELEAESARLTERRRMALNALSRDKDNAALQGELNAIQQDLSATKCKRTKQKGNLARLVRKETQVKYRNSLRKMGVGGTRDEFAQAHQQLLGIDAMDHLATAAEKLAKLQCEKYTGLPYRRVRTFFDQNTAGEKGKGKEARSSEGEETSVEGGMPASDDRAENGARQEEDEDVDEDEDGDEDEFGDEDADIGDEDEEEKEGEEAAGGIDAEDEVTDPNVELAGLSGDIEVSRIAVMRLYYGRLKASDRFNRLVELHKESGYCGFCPLHQAGLKLDSAQCKLTLGGPILDKKDNTRFDISREPAQSKKYKKKVMRHLRQSHPLQFAAIVAGGPIPPFEFEFASREDDCEMADLVSGILVEESKAPSIEIDLNHDAAAFGALLQEAFTPRSYHECI